MTIHINGEMLIGQSSMRGESAVFCAIDPASGLQVNGIPQHDRRRHQVQAAGPVSLLRRGFDDESIGAVGLRLAALPPTAVAALFFLL